MMTSVGIQIYRPQAPIKTCDRNLCIRGRRINNHTDSMFVSSSDVKRSHGKSDFCEDSDSTPSPTIAAILAEAVVAIQCREFRPNRTFQPRLCQAGNLDFVLIQNHSKFVGFIAEAASNISA